METTIPSSRINLVDEVEQALKLLTSQGYDTQLLWTYHNSWLQSRDVPTIRDFDHQWATRVEAHSSLEEHFQDGQPELLTAARVFTGRQYTLSPGQREVLRERYGLTPTTTVIAENVSFYSGTTVIFSLTLRSTEHIDPRRRRVLSAVVLQPVAEFFSQSSAIDKAREDEAIDADKERIKKGVAPKLPISLALQYLTK